MRLSVEALTVTRGGRTLFERLSFEARPGVFVEVHGPNGAGKTSLLRVLAGWLRPQAGAIRYEPNDAPVLHMIAHGDGLKAALSARAHARYWAGLLGGDESLCDAALDRVGLARIADLPARMLSRGQARRLALARLLVAPRKIWLLDEPAAGLDAQGKALLADLVGAHVREHGIAIAACHEPIGPNPAHVVRLG